ncbi:SDR family NAD(P)-dependent oxidoreductase [Candidatus Margulisiibacteriota bacterium]
MKKNKIALITGGAHRVGKIISLTLAELGFDVVVHYNSSKKEAVQTKKEIEGLGRRCKLVQANLLKDTINLKGIDVLVNNASLFIQEDFKNTKNFDKQFGLNFRVPYFLSLEYIKKNKKGLIINILDKRITWKKSKHFAYTLSKKALAEFTVMLANELKPRIRVNGIAPGYILPSKGKKAKSRNIAALKNAIKKLVTNTRLTGKIIFVG